MDSIENGGVDGVQAKSVAPRTSEGLEEGKINGGYP